MFSVGIFLKVEDCKEGRLSYILVNVVCPSNPCYLVQHS